jgi:hypothetical protein
MDAPRGRASPILEETDMLLSLCFVAILGQTDDATELTALQSACQQLIGADSYTFEASSEQEGGPSFGGRRGGFGGGSPGAGEQPAATVVTGKYVRNQPIDLSSEELHMYRLGDVVVHEREDGSWGLYVSARASGGRGGRGGWSGEGGGRAGGGGRGAGGDPEAGGGRDGGTRGGDVPQGGEDMTAAWRMGRILDQLERTQAPGKLLATIAENLSDESVEQRDGKTVVTAVLDEAAVAELFMAPGRGGRGGGGGGGFGGRGREGGGMQLAVSVQAVINSSGWLEDIAVEINMEGEIMGQSMTMVRTSKLRFSHFNATEVSIPEGASAAFEF